MSIREQILESNDDTGPGCREWKTGRFEGLSL